MVGFLKRPSPEADFVLSAIIGVVLAAVASLIPWFGLSFPLMLGILLFLDVVTYIAKKAGWIKSRGARQDDTE